MKYLVLLAFGLWLGWRAQRWAQTLQPGSKPSSAPRGQAIIETLVPCERCGVHVPQGQTQTLAEGRYRCTPACSEPPKARPNPT